MPSDRKQQGLDLDDLRQRLSRSTGPEYWRSLEELAGDESFQQFVNAEFPSQAADWGAQVGRREFLKLMGASLALAGVGACTRQPTEKIYPYTKAPEEVIPGRPLRFASSAVLGGTAEGILVESHEGRPTKIEGNPEHPSSLGSGTALTQASVLNLYDPDRAQVITNLGEIRPWDAFSDVLASAMEAQKENQGAGLRLLTGSITSPSLAAEIEDWQKTFPQAQWISYEPLHTDYARRGSQLAFGEIVDARYRLDQSEVVLSLDDDLLGFGPGAVRYTRDWTRSRRLASHTQGNEASMNRLYVVEASATLTGAYADQRLGLRHVEVESFAFALAADLGLAVRSGTVSSRQRRWARAIAEDLRAHAGHSLVVVGASQPPVVHLLAHAINDALGNAGKTVEYMQPIEVSPEPHTAALKRLAADIDAGKVDVLFIAGANPVYDAPADLDFAAKLDRVPLRIRLGLHTDETSERCHWHIPEAHPLEAWGDARSYDGTLSMIQPLIAPMYDGKTLHELVAAMSGKRKSAHSLVNHYWSSQHGKAGFDEFWRRALHDGFIENQGSPLAAPSLAADWASSAATLRRPADKPPSGNSVELVFRPDACVYDGRFANNGWLQELPRPLTKLTWDNAAMMAPATAQRLGLTSEDVIVLEHEGRSLEAPVWVQPGQPEDSVTLHLGYGRRRAGKIGNGVGFDAYRLRTSESPWAIAAVTVRKTNRRHSLAVTQHHHSMEGRHLIRSATFEQYRRDPEFAKKFDEESGQNTSMYPPYPYEGHAWGMVVDLSACTACNACTIACQAENNISVVGKDQVSRGRVMHWIRIDRYFEGDIDTPDVHHQPVLCMHCEDAPCEVVCPVGATMHSSEGLNQMIYNRCVGTRYCSNNCPYKVRRFNFYLYADWSTETFKLQRNPDVSVRSRGVMEKCTYCVQRINEAKIAAKREGRAIADGEILTACQQVCPSEAIVFGDINDPSSRVAQLKKNEREYGLLTELNTKPRTTYLAEIRNPNEKLAGNQRGDLHRKGHA